MSPEKRSTWLLLTLLTSTGCFAQNERPAGPNASDPTETIASKKSRVRFKGGERWATDLAVALGLPRAALCTEMGQYDCIAQAHRIVLGGVEPYRLGIQEPVPGVPVSAPIAVDRIALMACQQTVDAEVAMGADGPIFGPALALPASVDARRLVADRLFDRILMRAATDAERTALADFFDEVEGPDRPRSWATLTCFAVATTAEALFY